MAIQSTQVPMYTKHTLFSYFSDFSKIFLIKNKTKLKNNHTKTCYTKQSIKTRCKSMRKKEERKRSIYEDNTNVLTNEFKTFVVKRFGEQVNFLIIGVNKLKSENTIFDKLPNEVMSNLYMFGSRMLNRILKDVDGTGIVIIDGKLLLTSTITMEKFLHP